MIFDLSLSRHGSIEGSLKISNIIQANLWKLQLYDKNPFQFLMNNLS